METNIGGRCLLGGGSIFFASNLIKIIFCGGVLPCRVDFIFHLPRPSTSFNSKLGQKLAMDWMGVQLVMVNTMALRYDFTDSQLS